MSVEEAREAYGSRKVGGFKGPKFNVDEMIENDFCFYCGGHHCEVCNFTGKQSVAERLDKLESFQ